MSDGMYIMQCNYRSRYLVTIEIENEMKFSKIKTRTFKELFLTKQPKK